MTARELSDAIADGLDFENTLRLMRPLIAKTVRQHSVYGLDMEDVEQELAVVLWNCWRRYDRRMALFTTVVKRAFFNQFWKLHSQGNRRLPVVLLACKTEGCEYKLKTTRARGGKCPSCGNGRWESVHSGKLLSSIYAQSSDGDDEYELGIPDGDVYDTVNSGIDVFSALNDADEDTRGSVLLALSGAKVTGDDRRRVASFVDTI